MSVGSEADTSNIRKYPESNPATEKVMAGNRGHETQENHHGSRTRDLPKTTEVPFVANEGKLRACGDPEKIRRRNNRVRDNKRRWNIINSPMGVENIESKK